jgi:hypothetical protein
VSSIRRPFRLADCLWSKWIKLAEDLERMLAMIEKVDVEDDTPEGAE